MEKYGVWMWPESIYTLGADAVMDLLAAAGVTDVFLLTKGLAGKVIYHRTKLRLPTVYEERDILKEALCAAHKRGIRLHAWFTSSNDAAYKALFPQAGNAHFLNGRDNNVIRMGDAGYVAYMADILEELFATYALDGLHLDYVRFNHLGNGWAEEDEQLLSTRGADISKLKKLVKRTFYDEMPDAEAIFNAYRAGDKDVLALAEYRRDTVKTFAQKMIAAARKNRPNLPVSAALMPEGAYPDTAFSDLHYGQNYHDAAELYDFVVPMAYHVEYKKSPEWVLDVAMGAIACGNRTLAGIQAYGEGDFQAAKAAFDLVAKTNNPLLEGVCLFRYGEPACDTLLQA
jgi:Uncharacterized protein conserved in bacteria